ncbi:MAG: MarR family transcriptional regulator [Spirochaetes bacterium]|jgi:DNA-binding MarR family transcriptional regulator|nr:MarR family transcriptional regulator [Spirochaetota bacterium]
MDDRLLFLMSKAQYVLKNYLKKEFKSGGIELSAAQIGILFALKNKNGQSMNELGRIISIDNAAITRHVDALEREGSVKRLPDRNDRRKNLVIITRKGLAEAEKSAVIARRVNEMIKEGFSEDEINVFKAVFNSFLKKFI